MQIKVQLRPHSIYETFPSLKDLGYPHQVTRRASHEMWSQAQATKATFRLLDLWQNYLIKNIVEF